MNIEKTVPCDEEKNRSSTSYLTLRDALATMSGTRLAGNSELEASLASPDEALELLSVEQDSSYLPAILFCGDIHVHENGNEYVIALCLKKRSVLAVEKYWLDDPLFPSFTFALAE